MPADPTRNAARNRTEILERKILLESRPVLFNIDTTGVCNINPPCVFCTLKAGAYNYAQVDALDFDKYGDFLPSAQKVIDCSFGEPLTRADFSRVALSFLERGQTFHFSTNGLLLDAARLAPLAPHASRLGIIVSTNAATPETYRRLTGKDFDKLCANIRGAVAAFRQAGQPAPLAMSMIVMRANRDEVLDFLRLVAALGVPRALLRHLFETDYAAPPRDDFGYEFIYEREILPPEDYAAVGAEAKVLAASLGLELGVQWEAEHSEIAALAEPGCDIPCLFPWKFLFAQEHSGLVYPCCYVGQAVGGIEAGLEATWNGERLRGMRTALAAGRLPGFCLEHGHTCPLVLDRRRDAVRRRMAAPLESAIVMGEGEHGQLFHGWHGLEKLRSRYNLLARAVRWSKARAAFALDLRGRGELRLQVFEPFAGPQAGPVTGEAVFADGRTAPFSLSAKGWSVLRLPVPEACRREDAVIELRVDPARPQDGKAAADRRFLGLAVRKIWAT